MTAGEGIQFLWLAVSSRAELSAEVLFLPKQLAFYQEHQIRPRRLTDATRFFLVLWSQLFNWRAALMIVKPETLIGWHRTSIPSFHFPQFGSDWVQLTMLPPFALPPVHPPGTSARRHLAYLERGVSERCLHRGAYRGSRKKGGARQRCRYVLAEGVYAEYNAHPVTSR
jgi:hypothetical protein